MTCTTIRLEPFRIIAYDSEKRGDGSPIYTEVGTFQTQFDPDSFSRKLVNVFENAANTGINVSMASSRYAFSPANELSFQLIVDASEGDGGLIDFAADALGIPSSDNGEGVMAQINEFLELCYNYAGEIHQPRFLRIEWGNLSMPCRLQSVDIQHTMFSREGVPIRAKLDTVFLGDVSEEVRVKTEDRKSPDVSRQHIVLQGDSLPLISQKYYGSANYFLLLAKYNKLNHFRDLQTGIELEIPTLQKLLELTINKTLV